MSQTLKDRRVILRVHPLLQTKRRRGYPTHLNPETLIPSLNAITALYKKHPMYHAAIEEKIQLQRSQPSLLKSKSKTHLCSFKSGCLNAIPKKMKTTRKIPQHL